MGVVLEKETTPLLFSKTVISPIRTDEYDAEDSLTAAEGEETQGVSAREQAGTAQDPLIPCSLPSFYEWD